MKSKGNCNEKAVKKFLNITSKTILYASCNVSI